MPLRAPFHSLASVAAHLPFHLNETEKVNAAYQQWRREDDDEAKYHVDLWTYCFIRRYFLIKFTGNALNSNVADVDALIEDAYVKVDDHRATISDTTRYASWVSVVCKHTYLNYRRTLPRVTAVDHDTGLHARGASPTAQHDAGVVHEGLRRAIERLPEFLREVAYLRFVESASYQDIAQCTGKPLPIIRSYVNKAVVRLRSDPLFLAYLGRT